MNDRITNNRHVTLQNEVDYRDIPRKMKLEYSFPVASKVYRTMDLVAGLLDHLERPNTDLQALILDAAKVIAKAFSLKTVAIGLREKDGLYKYEAFVGYRPETEAATRKFAYTYDQFTDASSYKGTMISKYTKVFLAEDSPWTEDEREAYERPALLGMKRRSLDDYLEGDYLDVHILSESGDLLGWIEISGTITGKLPSTGAVKWIEFISRILAASMSAK